METTIKKPMVNIMMYHTIADVDHDILLSIMEGNKGLYMPSLVFNTYKLEYDNSAFIFGPFLESLRKFLDRNMTEEDSENLKDLLEANAGEETIEEIIEILEKGIELEWNKVNI